MGPGSGPGVWPHDRKRQLPTDLGLPVLGDTGSIFQGYQEEAITNVSYQGSRETVGVIS